MYYEIKDNNHLLRLSLYSNESEAPTLEVYINDEIVTHETYDSISSVPSPDPTRGNTLYTYEIPLADYEIGDIISKLLLTQENTLKPWDTHEGVRFLLDGEEVEDPVYEIDEYQTCYYTIDGFPNAGQHYVQAVYVGNDEVNPSWTDIYHFTVNQPEIPDTPPTPVPPVEGEFKLRFYDEVASGCFYGEEATIRLQLLKGGVPAGSGYLIETIKGDRGIGTLTTDNKGIVYINGGKGEGADDTVRWDAGKYKIGGTFAKNHKTVCRTLRNFEVKKAPSRIEIDGGTYQKGDKILFRFYYNTSDRLNKEVIQFYVNGKLIEKKTSEHGVISYRFTSKGTFKFKAVWKGNKNIEKAEFTTTVTISE